MKRILFVSVLSVIGFCISTTATATAKPKAGAIVKALATFGAAHCQHPKWSPSGKYLAYEVRNVKKRTIEIYIRHYKTGKVSIVKPDALRSKGFDPGVGGSKRGMVARELAWAPASKGLRYLFASNGRGSLYNVYLSREGKLKANSKKKNDGQPAWSSDAKRVVFTSGRSGKGDLYWFSLSSQKPKRLTKNENSTEFFPVWNPKNSRSVAYIRHTDQSDRIFIIKNVFAPKPVRLTKWARKVAELNPSWSPDGKMVAFFSVDANATYDLYAGEVGKKPIRLAQNVVKSDQYGPAWAPDGSRIFFVQKTKKNGDQIKAINPLKPKESKIIKTGTVSNNELSVVKLVSGKWGLAYTSQGVKNSSNMNFRKLFVKVLDPAEVR